LRKNKPAARITSNYNNWDNYPYFRNNVPLSIKLTPGLEKVLFQEEQLNRQKEK